MQSVFKKSGNTFFSRRFLEGLSWPHVEANWRFEVKEVWYRKQYGKTEKTQMAVYERDEKFDDYVSRKLPKRNRANAFWGFQGSSLNSLHTANGLGKTSIVELSTAHVTASLKILGEEAALHPKWADSIDNLVFPSAYEKRLREEPHIANKVIAASAFTKQTLIDDGVEAHKIGVLPLGFELSHIPYRHRTDKLSGRPLKLLYAGTLTQRKGLMYLLEAMKTFNKREVELYCIGGIQGSGEGLREYAGQYHYQPPVSQYELFKLYGEFDALVLPTIFEGFGLVIVEAMAAGLPVITTPHSMGPDVITDDKNGYLIPIRDINAIVGAIEKLRQKTDEEYLLMRKSAREAVLAFSWDAYKPRLSELLTTFVAA